MTVTESPLLLEEINRLNMNVLTSAGNGVAGRGMAAAASLIIVIPNIVLFIIMQSRVMDTMARSGIK